MKYLSNYELKQTCKNCHKPDGFNFHVPDEIWSAIVPEKFTNLVLCLLCFDRFAAEKDIDYTPYLTCLIFVGTAGFSFDVLSAKWGETWGDQ